MKIIESQIKLLDLNKQQFDKKLKPDQKKDPEMEKTSKELESLFLSMMIKAMEKTIPKQDGSSSNTLSSMLFSSVMGKEIANKGGLGLADMLYHNLSDKKDLSELKDKFHFDTDMLMKINALRSSDE